MKSKGKFAYKLPAIYLLFITGDMSLGFANSSCEYAYICLLTNDIFALFELKMFKQTRASTRICYKVEMHSKQKLQQRLQLKSYQRDKIKITKYFLGLTVIEFYYSMRLHRNYWFIKTSTYWFRHLRIPISKWPTTTSTRFSNSGYSYFCSNFVCIKLHFTWFYCRIFLIARYISSNSGTLFYLLAIHLSCCTPFV